MHEELRTALRGAKANLQECERCLAEVETKLGTLESRLKMRESELASRQEQIDRLRSVLRQRTDFYVPNKREVSLALSGMKIAAIRAYRERTFDGLREAKDAVEAAVERVYER